MSSPGGARSGRSEANGCATPWPLPRCRSRSKSRWTSRFVLSSSQRRTHGVEQPLKAERHVLNPSGDEEAGRAAHAAAPPAVLVLADALHMDVIVHFRGEARHVEPQLPGMSLQLLRRETVLVGKQQVVHLPELSLLAGALGGLGRKQRVRVSLLEGKMAEGEAHAVREAFHQQAHARCGLLAGRTLEVTVFDHDDRRVLGTE